jgi:hypothetical protein
LSIHTTLVEGRTYVTTRVGDEALLVHNCRIHLLYVTNLQQSIGRKREFYTFTSGATQPWIVDEIGEEQAGEAFLPDSAAGRLCDG